MSPKATTSDLISELSSSPRRYHCTSGLVGQDGEHQWQSFSAYVPVDSIELIGTVMGHFESTITYELTDYGVNSSQLGLCAKYLKAAFLSSVRQLLVVIIILFVSDYLYLLFWSPSKASRPRTSNSDCQEYWEDLLLACSEQSNSDIWTVECKLHCMTETVQWLLPAALIGRLEPLCNVTQSVCVNLSRYFAWWANLHEKKLQCHYTERTANLSFTLHLRFCKDRRPLFYPGRNTTPG